MAMRDSRQARRPESKPAAGIDAASMARQCQKQSNSLTHFSTSRSADAARWAGACFVGEPGRRGLGGTYTKVSGAARSRCADESSPNALGFAAVQARIQAHVSRRNKPPPTLSLAKPRPARSAHLRLNKLSRLPRKSAKSRKKFVRGLKFPPRLPKSRTSALPALHEQTLSDRRK